MIIRELIARGLEFVADFLGVHGLAIGVLATALVALYYVREAADAFVLLARWARMLSIIGGIVLALYVAGVVTGVVETGSLRSLVAQFIN